MMPRIVLQRARLRRGRRRPAVRRCAPGRRAEGAGAQRLQLVGLRRPGGAEGLQQGNRHQGALRHLRFQRHAGSEAPDRQVRLRPGSADRLFPRAADQGRTVPEARQEQIAEPEECLAGNRRRGLRPTIPATNYAVNYMWGTTGIGYNVKKAKEILGGAVPDSLGHRVQAGKSCQVQAMRRDDAGFRRRHHAGGFAVSRPQSELHQRGRSSRRRRTF